MREEHEASLAWLPVEVATLVLSRLSPQENCALSQTNQFWRKHCSTIEIWKEFCKSRFGHNDLTLNGFKKLCWTYPGLMSSWKDWFAFRSQFRREVAGSFELEVLELLIEGGDKTKRIPSKNISIDLVCLSQPPQTVTGARSATKFHFDEYHTLIQGEVYENRSWFYNRSCVGKFTIPVFQAKQRHTQVWIELEEPDNDTTEDCSSQADSETAVLSDDDREFKDHHHSYNNPAHHHHHHQHRGSHLNLKSSDASAIRQVRYDLEEHFYEPGISSPKDDISLADEDEFEVKSDLSSEDEHPRGRSRIITGTSDPKTRSAPTSPKRRRTASVKSTSSALGSSAHIYPTSGPISPSSSSSFIATSSSPVSRPSSPPYSPTTCMSPADPSSPRNLDTLSLKRKSVDMKGSKEIGMESSAWFGFLSTSPAASTDHIPTKRQIKRILVNITMNPVTCSVQDFEMVASISHGALNSPNELFLVKDKDSGKPMFMKIVPTISHYDEGAVTWEGSKESVAYSTTLVSQMPAHPFLVEQMTSFQTDNKLYLMMEWLGGGELFSVLRRTRHGRFDEHEALFYTAELVLGLEHMHLHKMIYRDLKPENLLLSADGHLKITQRTPPETQWSGPREFSIVSGHSMPEYLAPEILKGLPYSTKADSWSVGTILFHMLVGQPPFHHPNVHNLFASIIGDEVAYPPFLSLEVTSLLKGLLHRDVKKRFSLKAIRNHEWFSGLDWNKLLRLEYTPPLKPFRRQDLNFGAPARRLTPQGVPNNQPPPLNLAALQGP